MLEVEQRRQRAHALAHVLVVAGDLLHLVEEFFGKEVRIRIDPHRRSSGFAVFCLRASNDQVLKYHEWCHIVPSPACSRTRGFTRVRLPINWPKSDISHFGWRGREGACNMIEHFCHPLPNPSPALPASGGGSRPSALLAPDGLIMLCATWRRCSMPPAPRPRRGSG